MTSEPMAWREVHRALCSLRVGSKRGLRSLVRPMLALTTIERAALRSAWRDARDRAAKSPYRSQSWDSLWLWVLGGNIEQAAVLGHGELDHARCALGRAKAAGRVGPAAERLLLAELDRMGKVLDAKRAGRTQ